MMKTYKIIRMIDGQMQPITITSRYALKKWCRMAGHEMCGVNTNPSQRQELQGELRFKGLMGPMYDGPTADGGCTIRYEDAESNDRLSA